MKDAKPVLEFGNLHGGPARLVSVQAEGLDLLLLDAPHLYDRPGNIYLEQRWAVTGRTTICVLARCHRSARRWRKRASQAGRPIWCMCMIGRQAWCLPICEWLMAPAPPCVLTIHNIAFQGLFPPSICSALDLKTDLFTSEGMEYFGKLGFLKAGIAFSDKITTVSPTYARELMLPEFGMGLEGILQARQGDLTGILNGIDLEVWNPDDDPASGCALFGAHA